MDTEVSEQRRKAYYHFRDLIESNVLVSQDFKTIFSPNIIWIPASYHRTRYEGFEVVIDYFRGLKISFPDLRYSFLEEKHTENESWVLLRAQGTQTGTFLKMDPSGNTVDFEQMQHIKWSEDGKMEMVKVIIDSLTVFQQLGQAVLRQNNKLAIDQYMDSLRDLGLIPSS